MKKESANSSTHQAFLAAMTQGVVFYLAAGGIIFLIVGSWIAQSNEHLTQIIGDIIIKGSSAVLGAGVFAAVMKSAQFTKVFQKQIFEVFHDPKKLGEIVDLVSP